MFTGIQFENDSSRGHTIRPSTMDIFIRKKKLKLENLNDSEPLSYYLDDNKILKFLSKLT